MSNPRHGPTRVLIAEVPELPIERGLAGPGLLADTIVRRWQDHQPLHRIERIFARDGVPTDYSEDAELALRESARVLGPVSASARVVILHVYRVHPQVFYPWTPPPPGHRRNELAHAEQHHLEEIAAPMRALGFDVQVVAQEGHPAEVIDAEAIRVDADLIAMGTHGRSGLKGLLLGSVAERVLPSAPCPVLTVHTEASS